MSPRPTVIFLDMNIWVEMAKGLKRADERWQRLSGAMRELVASDEVAITLCSISYLELWHRREQHSREAVGKLMRDLTGYATLAPIDAIRKLEVEAFVQRSVFNRRFVDSEAVLGHGACHAFGSPFGRFRFVESVATRDGTVPEGRRVAAPENWLSLRREGPEWEWLNLVGTPEIIEVDGLERTPQHRIGESRVSGELRLRQLLRTQRWAQARLRDLVVADEIETLTDAINQSCWAARTQPHGLFLENPAYESPAAGMQAFVAQLPSVDTLATLREWKHRDLNHRWDQHDQSDLLSLSMALPYADIVVTERRWAHLCRVSGLAGRYGTQVIAMRDLPEVVNSLAQGDEPRSEDESD